MTNSTVNAIATAFQDEGFAPNPDCTYTDTSIRRVSTQEHLDSVDWSLNAVHSSLLVNPRGSSSLMSLSA